MEISEEIENERVLFIRCLIIRKQTWFTKLMLFSIKMQIEFVCIFNKIYNKLFVSD